MVDGKVQRYIKVYWNTPLKTNMEPKNEGFEDDFPFQSGDFQVPWSFFWE